MTGDKFLETILDPTASWDAVDEAANALVPEFRRGYPAEHLLDLLNSEDNRVARVGAWIAAELGDKLPAVVLDRAPVWLAHEERSVRYYMIDAVLMAGGDPSGELLARAIPLIDDPEPAVRGRAAWLLSFVDVNRLRDSRHALAEWKFLDDRVSWVASVSSTLDVEHELRSGDRTRSLFAIAAATRLFDFAPALLEEAAESQNEEVRRVALRHLEFVRSQRRWAPGL